VKIKEVKLLYSVVVLISGYGSNLQSIIDNANDIGIKIDCVISNKKNAYGIERAKKNNIKTEIIENNKFESKFQFEQKLAEIINKIKPTLIILAGFMYILSAGFINQFKDKIINIHPSLLPKFKGLNTHKRALEAGEKIHGASVHFVTNQVDSGRIIMQKSIKIEKNDDFKTLAKKVLIEEHILYPLAIKKILKNL
jgi:phosphoribosylglycinamide formyltransferase-1